MPQRDKLAKIAIAFHIRRQQNDCGDCGDWLIPVIPSEARNLSSSIFYRYIQRHADNRLDMCVFSFLVEWHGGVHTIRVRQRYGRHFLLDRCGDDLFGRGNASQKRMVAVTMQMDEHVTRDW
jgi:hypothetical protein